MGNDRVRRIGRPLLLIGDGLGKVGLEPLLVESLIVPRTVQVPNEVVQVIHPDLVALFHSHGNEGWTDRLHVQDPKAGSLAAAACTVANPSITASTCPDLTAGTASAIVSNRTTVVSGNCFVIRLSFVLPRATETFLPFKSARLLIGLTFRKSGRAPDAT